MDDLDLPQEKGLKFSPTACLEKKLSMIYFVFSSVQLGQYLRLVGWSFLYHLRTPLIEIAFVAEQMMAQEIMDSIVPDGLLGHGHKDTR